MLYSRLFIINKTAYLLLFLSGSFYQFFVRSRTITKRSLVRCILYMLMNFFCMFYLYIFFSVRYARSTAGGANACATRQKRRQSGARLFPTTTEHSAMKIHIVICDLTLLFLFIVSFSNSSWNRCTLYIHK
jgi:hypothetical protein